MKYRPRFTEEQKWEVWRRWKCGETTTHIATEMATYPGVVFAIVEPHGGIVPRRRCRSQRSLSKADREEISRGIYRHESMREIARRIGRPPSTVSREISRNTRQRCHYRAHIADERAWGRALRPKQCHLASNPCLANLVAQKLMLDWSPQQISGWLAKEFSTDEGMQVSHETIYRSLFVQARGVLKKQLVTHLRRSYGVRRGRNYRAQRGQGRGRIKDAVSIRERPAEVEDRAVPGHWEGDLLVGSGNSQIATLVERQSRFLILVKIPHCDTKTVVQALSRKMRRLPQQLRQSLTWDCGKEMAAHTTFSLATDVRVYFCDPASPWQRGSNENTNGLLRQYFRKKTDLSGYSQVQLDKIAMKLNQRPRETLGFDTPANKLQAYVASIH